MVNKKSVGSKGFGAFAAMVLVAACGGARLAAQGLPTSGTYPVTADGGRVYGGPSSGCFITAPARTQLTVVVEMPVAPGGVGTTPGQAGDFGQWNGSASDLSGSTTSSMAFAVGSKAFAKLQIITITVNTPAPSEMHWECTGAAKVGGVVKAQLKNAHGVCQAGGYSQTTVVYGGQNVSTDDQGGVALAHQGSSSVGLAVWLLGFQLTYDAAGSSESIKALGKSKPGNQDRAAKAVVDYVQKGEMSHSIQAETLGSTAEANTSVEVKGSALVEFLLVQGA